MRYYSTPYLWNRGWCNIPFGDMYASTCTRIALHDIIDIWSGSIYPKRQGFGGAKPLRNKKLENLHSHREIWMIIRMRGGIFGMWYSNWPNSSLLQLHPWSIYSKSPSCSPSSHQWTVDPPQRRSDLAMSHSRMLRGGSSLGSEAHSLVSWLYASELWLQWLPPRVLLLFHQRRHLFPQSC